MTAETNKLNSLAQSISECKLPLSEKINPPQRLNWDSNKMKTKLAKSTGKRNINSIKVEQLRALRRHGVNISYDQAVAIRRAAHMDRWFIRNKITPEYFMRVVETTSTRVVSFATGCGRYEIPLNSK